MSTHTQHPNHNPHPRFVLYTVGLDGPGDPQATLFTRHAGPGSPLDEVASPRPGGSSSSLTRDDCFSLLETQTLMGFMNEESLHGFKPVIPVPIWTDSDLQTHSHPAADELPWIEIRFDDGGDRGFSAIGRSFKMGSMAEALLGLGDWNTGTYGIDCSVAVNLREELRSP